jgi:hypothetical protein
LQKCYEQVTPGWASGGEEKGRRAAPHTVW